MFTDSSMRSLALLGIIVSILVFWLGGGCEGGGSSKSFRMPDNSMELPGFSIASVKHLPPIQLDPAVGMTDCGYSATFKGKSVWIFGDTFLSMYNEDGGKLLCNSVAHTLDQDAGDGIAAMVHVPDSIGAPQQFIELTDAEKAYNNRHQHPDCIEPPCGSRWAIWPGHIATHPSSESAYIFYHKVFIEPGFLNFRETGHSIAVWDGTDHPAVRPRINVDPNDPTILFPNREGKRGHAFASAALVVEDDIYVYGCEYDILADSSPCRLARVSFESALERDQWQFYSGQQGWTNDIESAEAVFAGCEIASVFYNDYLQQYIAIYSEPVSDQVMVRSAKRPEGPWTQPRLLFNANTHTSGSLWIYDALAHPEFSEDGGRVVYVTYSRQVAKFQTELNLVAVEFLRDR